MKNIQMTTEKSTVKVTIHIPTDKDVSETVKQQKINTLYDILKPKEIAGKSLVA